MPDEREARLADLFARACVLPPGEREAFARTACAGDASLLKELLELLEADAATGPLPKTMPPRPASHAGSSTSSSRILQRLSSRPASTERYRIMGDRIARGGMGAIFLVWDEDLQRRLAMKVVLGDEQGGSHVATPPDERRVARFLEEAQITGQLDHPGVVPVHELGLDAEGRTYFTMRLVRGKNLAHIFKLAHGGLEDWSIARALGVLHKVCETVAYAHSRDVMHRDLKPANIMVGRFGEVYVMDWGLARVVGAAERALVPEPDAAEPSGPVRGLRGDEQLEPDPLLHTREGQAMGTPAYMSPEQARGEREHVGFASDIYSVGAMLYELLAGAAPYTRAGERAAGRVLLERVIKGPPEPLGQRATKQPPELIAICEKAMARRIEDRYASMQEMGDDLRDYLEGRVVQAWKTGPWIEARKWVGRNRALAGALAAALVLLVGGALAWATAESARAHAEQWRADEADARTIAAELDTLGPIDAALVPALERWIARAEDLLSRKPTYEAELTAMRERLHAHELEPEVGGVPDEASAKGSLRALLLAKADGAGAAGAPTAPLDPSKLADAKILAELATVLREEALLEADVGDAGRRWASDAGAGQMALDQLTGLVRALRAIDSPHGGALVRGRERLRRARSLAGDTLSDPRWAACSASVASSPAYGGLKLDPQLGLVPLRRDAGSGLWEFAHVLSGAEPAVAADGSCELTADTCVVLVLVPGGASLMGSREPSDALTHANGIEECERPLLPVQLAPYFLSKYELTQAQWHRLHGDWPSYMPAGTYPHPGRVSLLAPVESVGVDEALGALSLWSLTLPTEAQWEWAARSGDASPGSTDRYWWGADVTEAPRFANFRDATFDARGQLVGATGCDDWFMHCPVGSFPANPWGFHEVLGNVSEWCLDWRVDAYGRPSDPIGQGEDPRNQQVQSIREGDGLLTPRFYSGRVARGGGYASKAADLRLSARPDRRPNERGADIGVRAARKLLDSR